jgi:hypothetical protein
MQWMISLEELYFRLWRGNKISNVVLPIRSTPHFEVAQAFCLDRIETRSYRMYISQAKPHDQELDSPDVLARKYLNDLKRWSTRFNLVSNPVTVSTRNGITFVVEGEHQAAYALACGYLRIPVRSTNDDLHWGWDIKIEKQKIGTLTSGPKLSHTVLPSGYQLKTATGVAYSTELPR